MNPRGRLNELGDVGGGGGRLSKEQGLAVVVFVVQNGGDEGIFGSGRKISAIV